MQRRAHNRSSALRDLKQGLKNNRLTDSLLREYDRSTEWINIGAVGAPAFQNSWNNYNAVTNERARFKRSSSGIVYVHGFIVGGASGTIPFVLPEGFRPDVTCTWPIMYYSGGYSLGECTINGSGQIFIYYAVAPLWVTLNTVVFPAEL